MIPSNAKKEMTKGFISYWEAYNWASLGLSSPPDYALANKKFVKPSNLSWVRLDIKHATGGNAAIGNKLFERKGFLYIQVFTIIETGTLLNDQICDAALNTFEGKDIQGIWFRNSTIREVGPEDKYYQSNVIHEFIYDEFKTGV